MHLLWLLPPAVSLALLGAHFHRAGNWPLVLACAALLGLLALPRAWVVRLVQVSLALGALEWLWTALVLVQARWALGQPWLRLTLILGGVSLFTAASAFVFRQRGLRNRFRLG
jgi:hypothetical protein